MSEIRGILIKESEKARLVKTGGREVWIPRSLTKNITKFFPDKNSYRECTLDVEDWFLEKEGL